MVGALAVLFSALSAPSTAISPCDLPTAGRSFDILRYCRVLNSRQFDCDSSTFVSTVSELWPAVRSVIHSYPAVFFDVDDRPLIGVSWASAFDIPRTKTLSDQTYWCADSVQVNVTSANPNVDRHFDYYAHILHKRWFETICGRQLLIIIINDVTNSNFAYPKVILSPGSTLQEFFDGFEKLQREIDNALRRGERVETVLVRTIQMVGSRVTERIKEMIMKNKAKQHEQIMGIPMWGCYSFLFCFGSIAFLVLAEYVVIRRNALGVSCMSVSESDGKNKPKSTNMMLSGYKDRAAMSAKEGEQVVFVPSKSAKASGGSARL
uniref:Uncharacterized protein n=1 Tax=Plectus sambesii TaxID=2011161 RepID=A0A914VM28_9BILA